MFDGKMLDEYARPIPGLAFGETRTMTPAERRNLIRKALDELVKDFTGKTADELEGISVALWNDERDALVEACDERVKAAEDETQAMACELAAEREKTRMANERVARLNGLLTKVRAISDGGGP